MLLTLFLFSLGLVFGSFIAALTYRYPRGISIAQGRSFCPSCKKQINWYDNIPIVSYILLSGRCRNCKRKISWRYPAVEIIAAFGFILIGFNFFALILFLILETIFVIDLENQLIPDTAVFLGIIVVIFYSQSLIFNSLLAGFLAASFLLVIHLITKGRGMGLGDVKFAILGGYIIGLQLFPVWLLLAFLTGAVSGIILILAKRVGLKSKIAFGPFLILAIPLTYTFGNAIIKLIGL
jgi:prepilin signal peptidase PulO-like enzyme (type II secretory pathway)